MPKQDSKPEPIFNSCPSCGEVIDVSIVGPFTEITCPHCSESIRVRTQFDQFVIESRIGEGGMSRVYAANDTRLGRSTALKVLHPEFSRDDNRTAQFEREAKLTAGVSHPNVVKVFSVGRDQGYFYIAMEHVTGSNLEQLIRGAGLLDEEFVLDLGSQVAGGLRAAHLEGLIHRDVKPGNILITGDNVAKLVDFGLALISGGEQDDSGEIWATPYYVPPEKLEGQPEDVRSDIYSLGATLFHALAGRPPFDADTNSLEELKQIKSQAVRLLDHAEHVSPRTAAVIDRMMAREPDDRYQTYEEVLEALHDARSLLGTEVAGPSKRRRIPLVGMAAAAAIALVLGVMFGPSADNRRPNGNNASNAVVVDTGGGTQVRTADGSTVAEKFIESRNAMFEKRLADAEIGFRELMTLPGVRQPTLNWARYNAGLCALIEGDVTRARSAFANMLRDAEFSSDPEDAGLVDMFRVTGRMISEPSAFSSEAAAQLTQGPDRVLGLLALGFERWASLDLAGARQLMEQFAGASAGMSENSINRYRELADPYLHDLRLVAPWLAEASTDQELDDALEDRKDLAKVAADLRTTSGPARQLVMTRLNSLDRSIQAMRSAEAEAERRRLQEVTRRELAMMAELAESLDLHRDDMNFAAAVRALEAANFESPEARAARRDRLYLWTSAEQFVVHLLDDLANEPIEGAFRRRSAPPVQGKLTVAERHQWQIEVASGEISIPFRDLDPRWLINLALEQAEQVDDSTEYYQRQEWIVNFAHVTGQQDLCEHLATNLMAENRSFRERWLKVIEMTFGS